MTETPGWTCLYSAEVELAAHNRHGHEDGFLRLCTSKFRLPGAHQLARDSGRTVVSGHAGNVGVVSTHVTREVSSPAVLFIGQVGWSLGSWWAGTGWGWTRCWRWRW